MTAFLLLSCSLAILASGCANKDATPTAASGYYSGTFTRTATGPGTLASPSGKKHKFITGQ